MAETVCSSYGDGDNLSTQARHFDVLRKDKKVSKLTVQFVEVSGIAIIQPFSFW